MQDILNCYFKIFCLRKFVIKLLTNKLFKNLFFNKLVGEDRKWMIGRVEDVIKFLKDKIEFTNSPESGEDSQNAEGFTIVCNELIEKIERKHPNKNDIIYLHSSPDADLYVLEDDFTLYKTLEEYILELEGN